MPFDAVGAATPVPVSSPSPRFLRLRTQTTPRFVLIRLQTLCVPAAGLVAFVG